MQLTPGFWNVIDKASNFGKITIPKEVDNELKTIQVFDEEKYLPPIDVSTNLFYYKGCSEVVCPTDSTIKDSDEVVIINARKMNNELNQIDLEPGDAELALDLNSFKNKELVLTAYFPCTSQSFSSMFEKVNIFTDKVNFTYSLNKSNSYNQECRYTDGRGYGNQYNLYRLNKTIQFNSIDLDNIPFLTYKDGGNTVGDVIEVPCKLSVKISGLILQQQCRTAKEWDRIDNITFDERVFLSSFFGNSIYTTNTNVTDDDLKTGSIRATNWYKFQPRVIGAGREATSAQTGWYGTINTNGLILKWVNQYGETQNTSNYCIIGKSLNVLSNNDVSLGGKYYYNDFQSMKILQNSVKMWKTYFQDTKYDGFTVYGDYSPNEKLIGEPYLNIDSIIQLRETYNGNNGNLIENDYSAAVVKTATDIRNVNNVTNINEILEGFTEIKLKHYGFDYKEGTINKITETISSVQFDFYGILELENIEKGGYVELTIDPTHISKMDSLHAMNYKELNPQILNINGEMTIRGTYLFLNGYPNTQQDILWDVNAQSVNNSRNIFDFGSNITGFITSIRSSDVYLLDDGTISGSINYNFTRSPLAVTSMEEIEVHHVNLPAPILTNIGVSFTDEQKENLDRNRILSS